MMILFSMFPLGGEPSRSSSVQVDILVPGNSRPQFTQSIYSGTIEEEQDGGVVILRVSFSAIDCL